MAQASWRRVDRRRARRCLNLDDPEALDALSADPPLLAACYAASIRQRAALGARAGMPVWRLGVPVEPVERAHRPAHGFSVHAGVGMGGDDRAGRERLIRYMGRPPVSKERLTRLATGEACLRLKTPWADGTT